MNNLPHTLVALYMVAERFEELGQKLSVNYSVVFPGTIDTGSLGNMCHELGRLIKFLANIAICDLGGRIDENFQNKESAEKEKIIAIAYANAAGSVTRNWSRYADQLLKSTNPELLTALWGKADDEDGDHRWYKIACTELRNAADLDKNLIAQLKTANQKVN